MTRTTLRITCKCGEQHPIDRSTTRITCACGAIYTATITQLEPPAED